MIGCAFANASSNAADCPFLIVKRAISVIIFLSYSFEILYNVTYSGFLPNRITTVQVCDATAVDQGTEAGNIIIISLL
jgi:hypothetical protein